MERIEILNVIQNALREVLDGEDIELSENMSPSDIEDWDSLAHFQLVMELQSVLDIKFSSQQIQSWKNVGSIIDSVISLK